MKNGKKKIVKILIKPIDGKDGCYLAYFSSGLLKCTYSVYFQDSIMGAVALHGFAEMIRMKYDADTVIIETDEDIFCQNEAVIDVINMNCGFESSLAVRQKIFFPRH